MRKVILDHGFSPGDAIVKFNGKINSQNGKTWVEVNDVGEELNLSAAAANSVTTQTGKTLTFEGKVTAPDKKSKTLELTELRNL